MLLGNNHHFVNTEGKSVEQIIDLMFKEKEIREAKEREDRRQAAAEQLQKAKAEVTEKKPAAISASPVTEPHGLNKVIQQVRKSLHI
ncbi:MAG TPA: hypothetical protein VEF76_12930 [Patescibacteria group bacterium]|nr:hypothetical protein [Patescibacteria group bacterium]